MNDRWTQERPASEEAASSFAGRILPELTSAILDKLDLTQIAIDHLDIDRILDSVDLDAVIERVDLDAVIHRVDLARIATEVIGEIDLPELIRESTGAVTSETVRAVRMRSAEADLFMGRIIDRLLMRKSADDEPGSDDPARRRQGEGRRRSHVPAGKPRVEVVPAEARSIQGHPAGLISRTIANILDLGLVFAFVAGTYVAWTGVKLLWQGREFTRPTPGFARAFAFATVVHIVYFAAAWTTSGRTFGDRLMGLRVVGRSGRTLALGWASIRALLCVYFPFGLLWAGIDRRHRSVQDLILRTSVIHDWLSPPRDPREDDGSDDARRLRVDVQPPVADEPHDRHPEPLPRLDRE